MKYLTFIDWIDVLQYDDAISDVIGIGIIIQVLKIETTKNRWIRK